MEQKIRVGAVSYLNTKPLVYGFEKGRMSEQVDLIFDYPANIAKMLLNNTIDIGLLPVAIIPELKQHYIISDFCIGASKPVASVCLFSDVPMNEITEILVDYQSRTSAALLKLLLRKHWHINPTLIDTRNGYQQDIKGTTAGLIIGDRALQQRLHSPFIYDLAEAWQVMTGLPFVFAAWVANKKLPGHFVEQFNAATAEGLRNLDEIVASITYPVYNLAHYYHKNIDYHLDDEKREGLQLFLSSIKDQQ